MLIQVFRADHLAALAAKQHNHSIEIEPIRGTISDRRLKPLALNVTAYSLYANPRMMSQVDKEEAVKNLSVILHLDPQFIEKRLAKDRFFVWIKRKLPVELADSIEELNINGLDFIKESKRYYPNGSLAAHLIGFSGIDNSGLEGIELYYNSFLKGESGWRQLLRDARQRDLMIEKKYISPRDGYNIVLTIDETIQYIAERALEAALHKHNAKAASIIVMDVKTGEILALANQPTYDLDHVGRSSIESRTNRAISFVYEPGSVFKIVTAAAALEEEAFTEADQIFCENGEYRIANHTLHDHHPHGTLTFAEVFQYSSNIGTSKIAQKLGPDKIYEYGQRFRFGIKTNIDILGEVNGYLKSPKLWSKTSIGAIPMGQEVTVTPLQLVAAIAAIANGGVYMQPYVVKSIKDIHNEVIKAFNPKELGRVISEDTAKRVTDILVGVVEEGTGKRAKIDGVKVAGKTGTAQKVVNGTYSHSDFYATFMGFAPADNPRIAAVIVFDEPRPSHFGGTVSGPVFKEVVENTLKYLESSQEEYLLPQLTFRAP